MFATSPAVRPLASGVARRAAAAPSDASERASGKKRQRLAPTRDSPACLTKKMTSNLNSVVTAAGMEVLTVGGETSSQELLQKRLACELHALRGLLKKAELISQSGASKGGDKPAAGKKERFLASSKQRPKPIDDAGGNAPSVNKMKISTLVEQKQMQAPRMSPEERKRLAGRLSSLCGEMPEHIVEFLQQQFGEADAHGEIEINIDSVEDSVMFELKMRLDKLAEESRDEKLTVAKESKDEKLAVAEESKGEVVREKDEEYADISGGLPPIATSAQPPSEPTSGTAQSGEAKKVQDVQRAAPKADNMRGLIYKANVRRQLLEMERAALPEQSIHRRDLQRLCIAEYGRPSVMQHIGLVLKTDA